MTSEDPRQGLYQLLEPLMWSADVTLVVPDNYVDVRGALRPTPPMDTEVQAREAHFRTAQKIIAIVEEAGWEHVDHPEIIINGDAFPGLGVKSKLIAEGRISLRLSRRPS